MIQTTMKDHIAILDFGSQYTHLIARRVRELGVRSHIYSSTTLADDLVHAAGIILSGGPGSIVKNGPLTHDPDIFEIGVPMLGLCYGHQLMAYHFGGRLAAGTAREYGSADLHISDSAIFNQIGNTTTVWMSHGEHVADLPDEFVCIANTGNGSVGAMSHEERRLFGFQYHPEVHHSSDGITMLRNFIFDICNAQKNWSTANQLEQIQCQIISEAGNKNVFLLLSGGVDSTVCYALLKKTLGKHRVYGLHVDHGMMRKNESTQVTKALAAIGLDDLHVANAETTFLEALRGVVDPEQKRKIIGDLFIDIANTVMADLKMNNGNWLLGQGTIYPDTIESGGTKNADTIKTHHNRVDKINEMIAQGLVIEPIKDLYKDEVRAVGRELGLPSEIVDRHPFPGPGLAIRCLCSDGSTERASVIASPDHNTRHCERSEAIPHINGIAAVAALPRNNEIKSSTAYTIYRLPIKSVGVQGDERSYAHPAVLTGSYSLHELQQLSPTITNQHHDINRVLGLIYGDINKLNASLMHKADVCNARLDLLRNIDQRVNTIVQRDPNWNKVWQMPIVLIPFGHTKKESLVIRPVESSEAMTVSFAPLHPDTLRVIIEDLTVSQQVDYIFYDLTNKPPGTIEWE
ncbi:MAG: glutamine-hydrolyzing GMP synthase [Candidatus Magasanikbacteria bacterium CG10_big_fil_rev_8_21_14_0_10_47_10]|uniref:GMP synthase (glutamine-hydrolyzing) n=1 Tax=Candidatus Magasanikbacteria bacterium CG10_big_fil_rev_8_21_14_0_10_47_10 TaxID=1974652 RepID=A0A2H0TRW9_9BACT|nr:MAG: glutamine-hydrolyzing GMP synthase [Candidatus Magasanikbacteria bacterium CG10_big_fil_rev_8_21_14_0_10_47_10]